MRVVWVGGVLLAGLTASGIGQTAQPVADSSAKSQPSVSFQFDRAGLPIPHFALRVREDGTGSYQADQAARSSTDSSMRGEAAQHIDRPIGLSSATASKVFAAARTLDHFNVGCASKAKNIADTGTKTLSYTGADGSGSCTYNFSENKTVAMLTDTFLAIANTMDEGRKLEFLHRYDRLGLDEEMNFLTEQVEAGRALELETISATLSSLADDTALMQRVRLRAVQLLEKAKEGR
ncbi:hypothetical protein [Granulicella sp. L60]|uniref:hypothetical protein n=1 Tax=Granulicella sp. L60 TaxID=1641866 RepID=UPI00131B9EC8|nr:hypothetical protein [Granulicella sp. L60]